MPVSRIEKIVGGKVVQRVEADRNGKFHCFDRGKNMDAILFDTLNEVADFLRKHPGALVRMNPGWSTIKEKVYIDGVPR